MFLGKKIDVGMKGAAQTGMGLRKGTGRRKATGAGREEWSIANDTEVMGDEGTEGIAEEYLG